MKPFRVIATVLTFFALAACTLIHIEGNSNNVSDIEGHTGTLKVPTLSPESTPAQ